MSNGWPVTVTVRTRPESKLRGRITHRERIPGFKAWEDEGRSSLQIRLDGGEAIAVERIADIARQRLAPEEAA